MEIPSNCILWAAWRLLRNEGTTYGWEWTKWNRYPWIKWPHVWWIDRDGVAWEYTTRGPKVKRLFPPPLFFGVVRRR
jgi:hypothetical protein